MDKVSFPDFSGEEFDRLVPMLIATWEGAHELADEWDSYHSEAQSSMIADFGSELSHLSEIREYVAIHELRADQQVLWDKLQQVMKDSNPILRSLGFLV